MRAPLASAFALLLFASTAQARFDDDTLRQIINAENGLCLTTLNGTMDRGTLLILDTCRAGDETQAWRFSYAGQGQYAITSARSGMCLDVMGHQLQNGAAVAQYTCNQADNQQWKFRELVEYPGAYVIVAKESGRCLDTVLGHTSHQWDCVPSLPQQRYRVSPE